MPARRIRLSPQAQANIDRFREWLAQHLAHSGWRESMEQRLPPAVLGPLLGVDPVILQRALEIRIGETVAPALVRRKLRVHIGALGYAAVDRAASKYGTTPGLLFMTLAHFAMAGDFEPEIPPKSRFILPNLGSVSISDGRGKTAQHGRVLYQVPEALGQALTIRARARGTVVNAYVRGIMSAWLLGQFAVPKMLWSWEEAFHDLSRYRTDSRTIP